jgi:protein ImuB
MPDGSARPRRLFALAFPRLTIDRLARSGISGGPDEPLVVAAKIGPAMRLVAACRAAERLGLHAGMALAQARALHPRLAVREAEPEADAALLDALADWAERYTPFVAHDGADGLVLDVTGAAHLFGGEEALLGDALARLARHGFEARGAVAGTGLAARALARFGPGGVAPPGGEAEAVAGLPLAALGLDEAAMTGLKRAGLATIGDLDRRPRGPLVARFGEGLGAALDAACGRADPPIAPRRPAPDVVLDRRFAEPVATSDAVLGALGRLAERLAERLEARGLGARRVEASFFRTDGAVRRVAVETARPERDPAVLRRLFAERIDALADPLDPGFGFDLVRLAAASLEPLKPAAPGFEGKERAEAALDGLADRLAARLGRRRVLRLEPQDTHLPEAAVLARPAQDAPAGPSSGWSTARLPGEPPARPLKLLDRPEPIEAVAEVPDGPPVRFRWRRVLRAVARAEGPERIAAEWWGADGPTRDYFRVEDESGRRFWLFREGLYGAETAAPRWFVHGFFA